MGSTISQILDDWREDTSDCYITSNKITVLHSDGVLNIHTIRFKTTCGTKTIKAIPLPTTPFEKIHRWILKLLGQKKTTWKLIELK
jgi:hypothetical protein